MHRVSQGSGIMLLSDEEIREMVRVGEEHGIEVNLFVGPRASFDIGAQAVAPAGKSLGLCLRGADQLVYALEDIKRAVGLGICSVLVSDIGLLAILAKMKTAGELPADLIIKTSVMMVPANPASARILEDLGATTINIPSDLSLPQVAAIRAVIDAPIDFYVEAPDNIGGFIRNYEVPELIRIGAPLYVKLGLRNAPDIYPCGTHIKETAVRLSRERRSARAVGTPNHRPLLPRSHHVSVTPGRHHSTVREWFLPSQAKIHPNCRTTPTVPGHHHQSSVRCVSVLGFSTMTCPSERGRETDCPLR